VIPLPARHRARLLAVLVALAAAVAAAVALPGAGRAAASPAASASAAGPARYAVNRPLCSAPADPAAFRCFAVEREPATASTPGAYRLSAVGQGRVYGYSPADLAKVYGYDPNRRVSQTVAVVDWYDDPNVLADLNAFDRYYHLPAETSRSFRKVNQHGRARPLPRRNRSAATEIALDVQAVRAVCHHCRILLVEADGPTANDIAAAENTAVRLGANEISNSFGGLESVATRAMISAFHHPGVVITASTGDDGWLGWDYSNSGYWTDGEAPYPAASPDVVAVGGTTLRVGADGRRASETVWNNNGTDNSSGSVRGREGASGGGCSRRFAAGLWQRHVPGYAALRCGADGRHRATADVAVVGDPRTGFDVRDTYGRGGWLTVGGTSLSAPLVAGMFALAGGSGGSAFPAASLYTNAARRPGSRYDVVAGGNGYCGGETDLRRCMAAVSGQDATTNNPNGLTGDPLDCSFSRSGATVGTAPPVNPQCNARPGYDGPSGLGAPASLALFRPTSAAGTLTAPARPRAHRSQTWRARLVPRVAGSRLTAFVWSWGDGRHSRTSTGKANHTFKRPGRYRVRVTAYDSLHQVVVRTRTVRVSSR
jgi:hypothetical protein